MKIDISFHLRHHSADSFTIEWEGRELLCFTQSGRSARVGAVGFEQFDWRDVLRWGAPYALAPQGQVVLHGSAVSHAGQAIAFLGVGGAGKSTLARHLEACGWQRLADDMIACDDDGRINSRGEEVMQRWIARYENGLTPETLVNYGLLAKDMLLPENQQWQPLHTLFFLDPNRTAEPRFLSTPLSTTDHFEQLVQYGFGGLPCPGAWENQFRVYGILARRVPAAALRAPDGVERMVLALEHFRGEAFGLFSRRQAANLSRSPASESGS